MAYIKKLEFGNYTLKFGDKKVLLDLFDEVVMPSFFEMKYVRHIKDKGDYFFLDTKLIKLNDDDKCPEIGICGRIVKNTKLKREQIFRPEGGLIADKSELETAPSSTFLLILSNHRLIFCKEVPGAPSIQTFQSTSQYCLKVRHEEFIKEQYEKAKSIDSNLKRVTKRFLLSENPYPILRITPLSDKESLKEFVSRFDHINKITIKLLPTNNEEINNDDFWSDFGRKREQLNSTSAKVEFSNTKEGLDTEEVYSQASLASDLGNSEVKLNGYDEQGDKISGSNEDFSLSIELPDDLPRSPDKAAAIKYNEFMSLTQAGVISLPKIPQSAFGKVKAIFERL